jgi:hypothetical protein
MEWVDDYTIKLDKELSELDKLLFSFLQVLRKYTNYVIVSGYVSILFGRARATEDIDVIIEEIDWNAFQNLFKELENNEFWCINASEKNAFSLLEEGLRVRFAKKDEIIPNIEIKFYTSLAEKIAIENALSVAIQNRTIRISPLELQIAFKEVLLASEKDLEDAEHLREVFKDSIDEEKTEHYKKLLESEKKW